MSILSSLSSVAIFRRREDGASLIEYTVVFSVFLLIFFAILDFGRLGFNWVMTEKAMQRAARIATVRPPVCNGVPDTLEMASTSTAAMGTLCRVGGVCEPVATQSCVLGGENDFSETGTYPCGTPVAVTATELDARNAQLRLQTAQEIWCILEPILPSNAAPNNIWLSYEYDGDLGFAGGPYVPMVEVAVVTLDDVGDPNIEGDEEALCFDFITPIPGFAAMAGGVAELNNNDSCPNGLASIPFPDMSVSLPGEDLNQGTNG